MGCWKEKNDKSTSFKRVLILNKAQKIVIIESSLFRLVVPF